MTKYQLKIREVVIRNHQVIVETDMDKEELENLLEDNIGIIASVNDVVDNRLQIDLKDKLKIISLKQDDQGESDEAQIDEIEELDDEQ